MSNKIIAYDYDCLLWHGMQMQVSMSVLKIGKNNNNNVIIFYNIIQDLFIKIL